jgi:hypothetical protein
MSQCVSYTKAATWVSVIRYMRSLALLCSVWAAVCLFPVPVIAQYGGLHHVERVTLAAVVAYGAGLTILHTEMWTITKLLFFINLRWNICGSYIEGVVCGLNERSVPDLHHRHSDFSLYHCAHKRCGMRPASYPGAFTGFYVQVSHNVRHLWMLVPKTRCVSRNVLRSVHCFCFSL